MNRMTFRSVITALVLLVLLCVPSIASADGVTWSFSGVVFDDNGTASGSFVYDAVTNTVSSIDIVTTAGTTFLGATYTGVDPGFTPSSTEIVVVPNASLIDFTGTMVLDLVFGGSLTNSGGIVSLAGTGEFICLDAGCTAPAATPFRLLTAGEVATPEPSALLLLGTGLVGLVGAAKRKVFQA